MRNLILAAVLGAGFLAFSGNTASASHFHGGRISGGWGYGHYGHSHRPYAPARGHLHYHNTGHFHRTPDVIVPHRGHYHVIPGNLHYHNTGHYHFHRGHHHHGHR
ncbi:hypothetical protein SH668x_000208 [Planctomicrobium sp. SH668]|uniref:hypothetical protein n=1 Tax=Planctomicrobium sp. SH668 TaxID=3448126 RepID=UPI003F5C4424